ncbi:MAG: NAD-dependent epimerase/dehydratase family protein, partial [Gemmatimonadota bacterium]|nr:NAD-dependent epimerase/dehydratase family protein [Gemmatimonadota bacterium]
VYGRQPTTVSHVTEDAGGAPSVGDPASAYAEGKRAAELLGTIFGAAHNLPVKIARCFAFVGPGLPLDAHFAIGNLMGDALAGRHLSMRGDGTPRRSYMYGADLAVWLWTILLRGNARRAYNVGAEDDAALSDVAATVGRVAGDVRPVSLGATADRARDADRYVPSTVRAREELGLRVEIKLEDAIRRTLAWHRAAVPTALAGVI